MSCSSCNEEKCCCPKPIRGSRGPTGPRGATGATGAAGPAGPAGTITTYTDTSNPTQSINGAQVDVAITDLLIDLPVGTYVVMLDADVLNNSDSSEGTYTLEVTGAPVGQPRNYEPGVLVNGRGTKKFIINEVLTLAAPGSLTVSITQTAGELVVKRSTLVVLKTA